jgi:thiol-disulfide isomerase/thioredoxin
MTMRSARPALLDVFSGVIAIVAVVGTCMASRAIGFDFRAIYALTSAAFFLAGFVRGSAAVGRLGWQVVRVSVGGFLGTAALVMNNGPHLLLLQIGLVLITLAVVTTGIVARRRWQSDRGSSVRLSALSLIAAGLIVFFAVPRLSTYAAFEGANRPLASFTLQADDHVLHSEDLRGHVVILAFWASWCVQCLEELPELQTVYTRFQNNPQVVFLAVDTGWDGETLEKGNRRLAQHHLALPNVFDSGAAAQSLSVDALPTLVLLDRNGSVKLVHHGYDRAEHLDHALSGKVEELLANPHSR